jgi:hypothetical protein
MPWAKILVTVIITVLAEVLRHLPEEKTKE